MSENLDFEKLQLKTFLEFSEEISAIAYHKGKIAVALSSSNPRIEIWNYKSNQCDLTIDTNGQEPRCLKFDDNIIMSMFDVIGSWALPSGERHSEFKGDDTPCYSFDHCSKFNIVVGCFSDFICIWNMSTGEEVKRIDEEHGSVQRVFIYPVLSHESQNLKLVHLLVLKEKEVEMWRFRYDPGDMQEHNVNADRVTTVYPSRNPFRKPVSPKIDIFQFKERFLYYFQHSMVINKIVVWDMMKNLLDNKIEVSKIVKNLLAVGDKYIAFVSEISGINEESFVVIDKESGNEVAVFRLPYELQTIGADSYPSVIMGDTSWLDDPTKENKEHIICICVCMRQIVNVLKIDERFPENIKEDVLKPDSRILEDSKGVDELKLDKRLPEYIKEGDVLKPDLRNPEDTKSGDVLKHDLRNPEDTKSGDVLKPDIRIPEDTKDGDVLKLDKRLPEDIKEGGVLKPDPMNPEDTKGSDVLKPDQNNLEDTKDANVLKPDNMNPQDTKDKVLKQDERHPEETKVDDVYKQDGCYADEGMDLYDWYGYCSLL